MTITIEVETVEELEKILVLCKSLEIEKVKVVTAKPTNKKPTLTKGNKKLSPTALFGIWKDEPRSLEQLRAAAWQRNWDL